MDSGSGAAPVEAWMRAVESRDSRFDGWVIVGVLSTGIYCRPSCPTPVRPKRRNMRFFSTPAAAQADGFRACKRCAPDATPGSPEWNRRDDLVARAVRAIEDGAIDRIGVGGLAEQLALSPRHLQRLLTSELGASPLELARARRARTALLLIDSTDMPFGDVAFAAGFSSVRQFNDTIRQVFARTPSELRGSRRRRRPVGANEGTEGAIVPVDLRLSYRRPYDAFQVGSWFADHAIAGVEEADAGTLRRSLRLAHGPGVIEVDFDDVNRSDASTLTARFHLSDPRDLHSALRRARRLLDLDADPAVVNADLGGDPGLGPLLERSPGVRSPGDVDPFDALIRAIVHQQVSVAGAVATLGRLAAAHGTPLDAPVGGVTRLLPTAEDWAALDPSTLGLPRARAATLVRVATEVAEGRVVLSETTERQAVLTQLASLKGIGPWTCGVVDLRGFGNPDAFLPGDLILSRVARQLDLLAEGAALGPHAERWRPWRAYAMHQLWHRYRLARSEAVLAQPDAVLPQPEAVLAQPEAVTKGTK